MNEEFNPVQQEVSQSPEPQMQMSPENKSSVGPLVGAGIIVLVLVLGGLYFWGESMSREAINGDGTPKISNEITPESVSAAADPALQKLSVQSSSTKISDIKADLNTTDMKNIDAELQNISEQLNF